MHRNLTFRNQYWKIIWKRASQSRRFPVCFQSVKRTIYRKMERCRPRGLNFSNTSDDELDRNVTEAKKDFPFCAEQMLTSSVDLRPKAPKNQTPKLQAPRIFLFLIIYFANSSQFLSLMFYGHAMFKGNSQKESKYLSSPVYRCRIDQTVKN